MTTPGRSEAKRSGAVLVYMILLVSLQVFLLVVALEGVLGQDPTLAASAAAINVVLFLSALGLRWFLRDD